MTESTESKYVKAIMKIGQPCTPKSIRREVNQSSVGKPMVSPQNCASALNNLLARNKIIRDENTGLYSIAKSK